MIDPINAELVATHDETAGDDLEYERVTSSLYVTAQRTFFIVERFFSFDGRPTATTKSLTLPQARAWCTACGLHARTIDRYVMHAPHANNLPQSAALLTQQWGMRSTSDNTGA